MTTAQTPLPIHEILKSVKKGLQGLNSLLAAVQQRVLDRIERLMIFFTSSQQAFLQ
jgi:hypothetical protein